MPGADSGRDAFMARVSEAFSLLETPPDAPVDRTAHLARIDSLLDRAEQIPIAAKEAARNYVLELRANAHLRLAGDTIDEQVRTVGILRSAWRANREAEDPLATAALGFNYANRAIKADLAGARGISLDDVHDALTTSHQLYRQAGLEAQAGDAAFLLAQTKVLRIQHGLFPAAAAPAEFDEAWRLASAAIAATDPYANGAKWAERQEKAADILLARPDRGTSSFVDEAVGLLLRAHRRYVELGDREAVRRCIGMLLLPRDGTALLATPRFAWAMDYVLRTLQWCETGVMPERPDPAKRTGSGEATAGRQPVPRNLADAAGGRPDGASPDPDVGDAMRIAGDPGERRRLLSAMMATLADYSAERIERRWAPYAEMLSEMEVMRRAGIPERDPTRWEASQARLQAAREFIETTIAQERADDSGALAKRVLAEHLEKGTPFVLLLRAFSLEVREVKDVDLARSGGLDGLAAVLHPDDGFPGYVVEQVRGPWSGRVLDTLAAIIPSRHPALMIANKADDWAPEQIAKFYVGNIEWRQLAFPLIAEAAAIVLLLPLSVKRIAGGVLEEIDAIGSLGASGRTIAVVEADEAEGTLSPGEFDAVVAQCGERGLRRVVRAEDVIAAPDAFMTELADVMSTASGPGGA